MAMSTQTRDKAREDALEKYAVDNKAVKEGAIDPPTAGADNPPGDTGGTATTSEAELRAKLEAMADDAELKAYAAKNSITIPATVTKRETLIENIIKKTFPETTSVAE